MTFLCHNQKQNVRDLKLSFGRTAVYTGENQWLFCRIEFQIR
jgi:hypothetical protein